jgi:hypothetical protein
MFRHLRDRLVDDRADGYHDQHFLKMIEVAKKF